MRTLWRKTWRDIRNSWAQTLALTLVIAIGITTFVASIGAYRDLGTSYNETYRRLHFADVTFHVQAAPADVVNRIAQVPGVRAAAGRLIVDTGLESPKGEPIRSRLIGLPTDNHPSVNDILILEGRYLKPGDDAAAVVESHFSDFYDIHPGNTVTPLVNGKKLSLKVVGVAVSPEYLVVTPSRHEILLSARSFAVLFVPLPYLQHLVGAENTINDIGILVEPGADRDEVIAHVRSILQPYTVLSISTQEKQPSNQALHLDLQGFHQIAYLMPALILIVAAFSVYIMLNRHVRAQQGQIGVMKAVGYGNAAVLLHYVTFGLVIGLLGAILGTLLGVPFQRLITGKYAEEVGIPIVKIRFYADTVLTGLVTSLLVVIVGSAGPARAAAAIPPAQAMRIDPAVALAHGRRLFFERWVPLSTWMRMALRNVFRIRRRSLGTWLGIVFAFILVLASWGLFDSMDISLRHTFREVERWDVEALFSQPQTDATLAVIRGWDGVRAAEPAVQLPTQLRANGHEMDVLLIALEPRSTMHVLQTKGRPASALSSGHLVTSPPVLKKLGLRVGDRVEVKTPFGTYTYTISGETDEAFASVAYIPLDDVQRVMKAPVRVFNVVYLRVDPNRVHDIKKSLYALPGVYSVQYKADVEADWRTAMSLAYALFGIFLAFALVMTVAVLFNTMTVNVMERQRELATMRAVGAPNGRIAALILVEAVIIWLLALIPGLLLGTWAMQVLANSYNTDLFYFKAVILPRSYVFASMGILVGTLIAAWPSIRYVNRLNLAETTKMIT